MVTIPVTLLTGRSLAQGQSREISKTSARYEETVAVCMLDPADMKTLQISTGTNVRVTTAFGHVVVKGLASAQTPHAGLVFMPCGPWASVVVDPETKGTGMPAFKGIEAEVEPADGEAIPNVYELASAIRG